MYALPEPPLYSKAAMQSNPPVISNGALEYRILNPHNMVIEDIHHLEVNKLAITVTCTFGGCAS